MIKQQLLCALLLTGSVLADQSAARENELGKMDTDGNGTVSLEEFTDYWQKWFVKQDKNGDSHLDEKECTPGILKLADADKDGSVTSEEHLAARTKIFKRMDLDQDGVLTKEELAAPRGSEQ